MVSVILIFNSINSGLCDCSLNMDVKIFDKWTADAIIGTKNDKCLRLKKSFFVFF
jgi:hypothetical protein